MLENMVLRKVCGPKRDGVTGEWRKLHNEELNDLYCSPDIVRVMKSVNMCGLCGIVGKGRGVHRVLDHLGRPRHKWEGNITIGVRYMRRGHGRN